MAEYTNFRQRLDAVLRTLDVNQVQNFLLAEKQWSPGVPADPEFAMWMMIAGSPTLQDLHGRAREWLFSHGHDTEALALLGKSKQQSMSTGKKRQQAQAPKKRSPLPPTNHIKQQPPARHQQSE